MAAKAKTTTTTKKSVRKPAATKRVAAKKTTKKTSKEPTFFEAKFTEQSAYWIIFGSVAILFAIWLYSLDAKIRDLYDQVDANAYNLHSKPEVKPKKS